MNPSDAAAGGSWSPNIRVNDVPNTVTGLPSIAVDAQGNVYALWMDIRNGQFGPPGIYFSLRDAGTGVWSGPSRVSDAVPGPIPGSPGIRIDGFGNAYAVWLDARAGSSRGYDVFTSRRDASTGVWGTNARVNSTSGTVPSGRGGPALAVDSQGNAFVLWSDDREGAKDPVGPVALFASRRDAVTGQWSPDQRFSQEGEIWGSEPLLAVDGSGTFYVIWLAATGYLPVGAILENPARKFSRWQPATGVWSPGVVNGPDQGLALGSIVVDAQGNIHGVTERDFVLRDAATGAWSTPVNFRDPAPGEASGPSISLDSQGNGWVAWVDTRNQVVESSPSVVTIIHGPEIWAARRDAAAGAFGPNMRVDDHTVGSDRYPPRIGIDQRGNVYAAWLDFRENPRGLPMPGTGAGDIYFSMTLAFQASLPLVAKGSVAGW